MSKWTTYGKEGGPDTDALIALMHNKKYPGITKIHKICLRTGNVSHEYRCDKTKIKAKSMPNLRLKIQSAMLVGTFLRNVL